MEPEIEQRETNFTFGISIIVLYTFRISLNFHNVLPVTHRKKLYEVRRLEQQQAFKEAQGTQKTGLKQEKKFF